MNNSHSKAFRDARKVPDGLNSRLADADLNTRVRTARRAVLVDERRTLQQDLAINLQVALARGVVDLAILEDDVPALENPLTEGIT